MRSKKNGASTPAVEVLNISPHGFWLMLHEREYFLAFEHFPWFRRANLDATLEVQLPQPHHLYWPKLDVDLELASIISPEKYPLVDRRGLQTKSEPLPKAGRVKRSRANPAPQVWRGDSTRDK